MNTDMINPVLQGCISALAFVAGLFFLRFWLSTLDRFFVYFAASFWIEAGNRLAMGLSAQGGEDSPVHYGIRLLSYGLILIAIWDKNRSRS
jgi:hypothetical protein